MEDEIVTDLDELSRPVEHDSDVDHRKVARRLESVLDEMGGLGLSANQIGISGSRTCLVRVKQDIFFVNPRIVSREGTTRTEEGCLSIPNERVQTERSSWVEVQADAWLAESVGEWNEIGGTLSFGPDMWTDRMESNESLKQSRGDYLESIAVAHEINHLNGKTIYDRQVQNQPFEKSELQRLGRNDKVYVRNEDGEEFNVKWKHAKKHEDWTVLEINEK
jgi:peptide deformylase